MILREREREQQNEWTISLRQKKSNERYFEWKMKINLIGQFLDI